VRHQFAGLSLLNSPRIFADLDAGSSSFLPRNALICFLICLLCLRAYLRALSFLHVWGSWSLVVEKVPTSLF
jgi:hypothetical protein